LPVFGENGLTVEVERQAVVNFQAAAMLAQDAIVGQNTWRALITW